MRRHSPYNYAFNNLVFFIDPDGMAPLAGMQTGAVEHTGGFEVSRKDGSNAQHFSNVNDAVAAASDINTSINAQNYSNFFKNAAEEAANADVSLDEKSADSNPFYATIIIDESVPKEMFNDIAIIREDEIPGIVRTFPPDKHGKINKVDGAFLRGQSEKYSWFKISDHAEATIYYDPKEGLYIEDTSARFNLTRLIKHKYYVDWVDKNDKKRERPTDNPFENN